MKGLVFRKDEKTPTPISEPVPVLATRETMYNYHESLMPEQRADALKEWYLYRTGLSLDLENPITYNEKLQWFKLYGYTPMVSQLADKYLVRAWVQKKIGSRYLVPLLGVWDRVEDIPFDDLPERFALKANHGSGYNMIVSDKQQLNLTEVRATLNSWLEEDFSFVDGLQMFYSLIEPKIIAEKYLDNHGDDLYDYKAFCFNGHVEFIEFISGRENGAQVTFFDRNWNKLPITTQTYLPHDMDIPKPENLEEILKCAERLSAGFPHVRVDFYRMDDGTIYFGEMTFTPTSGVAKWDPPEIDVELGKKFSYMGI